MAGTNPRAPAQAALGDVRPRQVLRHIGEPEAGERRIEHLEGAVEDELAVNAHLQLAPAFLELPGVQPAMGRKAQIDAVVPIRSCGVFGAGRFVKYDGAPTTAMRMSGPMRTAIMSLATCSPLRTPASKRCATISVRP